MCFVHWSIEVPKHTRIPGVVGFVLLLMFYGIPNTQHVLIRTQIPFGFVGFRLDAYECVFHAIDSMLSIHHIS